MTSKTFNKNKINNLLVVSHVFKYDKRPDSHCPDGLCCHNIVKLYYEEKGINIDTAIFMTFNNDLNSNKYTQEILDNCENRDILLLDLTLNRVATNICVSKAISFLNIDQHDSGINNLIDLPDELKIFKNNQASCITTFEYFFPDRQIPRFMNYVSDNDAGKIFDLTESEKLDNDGYLFMLHFKEQINNISANLDVWKSYFNDIKVDKEIKNAKKIAENIYDQVTAILLQVVMFQQKILINNQLKAYNVAYVENNNWKLIGPIWSRVAETINPDIFSSYTIENSKYRHSLRTHNKNEINVCEVAKLIDSSGGGQAKAASCIVVDTVLPFEYI